MKTGCVFCGMEVPTREHHIVPRAKGGKETVSACETCENFIHKTWSHNELRDIYNNVETILSDIKFQKFLKWRRKQSPETAFKSNIGKFRNRGKYS